MRTIGKTVTAAAMAVALLVAGAIAFGPTADGPAGDLGTSVSNRSSSALLAPVVSAGSLDGTIASLQDRLRAVPDDWRSSASLGLAYVAQARVTGDPSWYPKAEGVLARSLRVNADDNVEGLLGLGVLDLARHDFSAALRRGRRAAALDPHGAEAYGVIGDALLELGRYDRAFRAFQTMVDTRPDLSSYARVAYARELVGDVRGAERAMQMAFDAAGTPADAAWTAYQLGELAFGSGDVRSARGWYARGRELDPSYVPNLAGLAKVAWARGDDVLAVERFTDVVSRYPSAEFVVALADLYRATGRQTLAEQQEDVVRAMHELASESGVNVDLELALFDADHGDPAARARGGSGRVGSPAERPRRRRVRLGPVRERPVRSGIDARRACARARHAERAVPVPRGDDPARARGRAGSRAATSRRRSRRTRTSRSSTRTPRP